MRAAFFQERDFNSDGNMFRIVDVGPRSYLTRSGRLLARLSRMILRVFRIKTLLLVLFACSTGFFVGATWAILELAGLEEEGGEVIELTLKEARIWSWNWQ